MSYKAAVLFYILCKISCFSVSLPTLDVSILAILVAVWCCLAVLIYIFLMNNGTDIFAGTCQRYFAYFKKLRGFISV